MVRSSYFSRAAKLKRYADRMYAYRIAARGYNRGVEKSFPPSLADAGDDAVEMPLVTVNPEGVGGIPTIHGGAIVTPGSVLGRRARGGERGRVTSSRLSDFASPNRPRGGIYLRGTRLQFDEF